METYTNTECPICMCDIEVSALETLNCSHSFCLECIKQVRDAVCPVCRAPIESKNITKDDIQQMNTKKHKDKVERERRRPTFDQMFGGNMPNFYQMGGNMPNVRVRVEVVNPSILSLARKLISTYKYIIKEATRQKPEMRAPLRSFIMTTANAIRLISIVIDGNIKGCNELLFEMFSKDLPKLYPNVSCEDINAEILEFLA